jgi:hypothetical protein
VAPILERAREALDAGVTHLYLHQIGPRQEPFLEMAARDILPALRGT